MIRPRLPGFPATRAMGLLTDHIVPLTGADCFVLALNRLMRRNGQHGLIGQTHLLLAGVPDIAQLRAAADRLSRNHPVLDAKVKRAFWQLRPEWRLEKNRRRPLPVLLWHESGATPLPESRETSGLTQLAEEILNQSLQNGPGLRNLRLDLVLLANGESVLLLTWSHLLFDGKGAELLISELMSNSEINSTTPTPVPPSKLSFSERAERGKPVVSHFFKLARNRYRSLAGPHPRPGRLRFRMLHLDESQTMQVKELSDRLGGALFNVGFYLACAVRAHRRAFLCRGEDPGHYVVSVPVQVRRKGGARNPFHNSVTVLFFSMKREDLETIESAVQAAQKQFEEMTRAGLDRSFLNVLELMRLLPSPFYMKFVEHQFAGEVSSFFHSFTGSFAAEPETFFNAPVRNAYHIPSVSSPPGSGLFFGMYRGQLTVTCSWRDGAVSEQEVTAMLSQVEEDFLIRQPTETIPICVAE